MGGKVSSPDRARQEPPSPFALPCLPNEFISGDAVFLSDDYVPYPMILEHKCIVARIVNVADGDTFRGRHIPNGHKLYPYPVVKKHQRTELFAQCEPWKGKLKGETLRFRIYGVDAPETAKMGRPGQPFAEEAVQYMKNKLLNRIVFVRLLAKDQYGRLIVQVLVPCSSLGKQASLKSVASMKSLKLTRKFSWSVLRCCFGGMPGRTLTKKERVELCEDVSESLLMKGLATIYTGQNAQYNGKLARLEQLLLEARDKKVGMFASADTSLESPASFKRRMRDELLETPSAADPTSVPRYEKPRPQRGRGRSPERGDRRRAAGATSSQRANQRRLSEPTEGDGKAPIEAPQGDRAKGGRRRKRKSRSRSARRRRAAERAFASAGGSRPSEQEAPGIMGVASNSALSAQSRSIVPAGGSSRLTTAGSRKGLHVRGISGSDESKPSHTDTITFSAEEPPAVTGSRRGLVHTDQQAVASMSFRRICSLNSRKEPAGPALYLQAEAEPVVDVDDVGSINSGELSENEYEDEDMDESESGGEEAK
ncbi:hypothetical protein Efla_005850 [Eimeria flavescens]